MPASENDDLLERATRNRERREKLAQRERVIVEPLEEAPLEKFGSWTVPVPRRTQLRITLPGQRPLDVEVVAREDTSVAVTTLTLRGSEGAPVTGATLRTLRMREVTDAARSYVAGVHRDTEMGTRWATTTYLRRIPLGEVMEKLPAEHYLAKHIRSTPALAPMADANARNAFIEGLRESGPHDPRTIEVVAELYLVADQEQMPPNRFVASLLGLTEATASRWISAARAVDKRIPENPRSRKRKAAE